MWQNRVPLSKNTSLAHVHDCLVHVREVVTRSLRKSGSSTRVGTKTIPDNGLAPTFYKLRLGRCPHQHSLPVAETWALSIGITSCNEIKRRHQIEFADTDSSWNKVFLSLAMYARISACTFNKRFLWGPHDVGSDSLHGTTVLSLPVDFPMLGSIWHSTLNLSYRYLLSQ